MTRLRVAFISLNYAPETTGIAPYSTSLAEALAGRGHDVQVVAGFPHYPEWRRRPGFGAQEVRGGVRLTRLEHPVPARPGIKGRMRMESSFAARCLRTPLDDHDVLLVVSPSLLSAAAAVSRGRLHRSKVPVVVWVQDLYGLGAAETGMLGSRAGALLGKAEAAILRAASKVVVIHQRFADGLISAGHLDPDRVSVIRNWTHVSGDSADRIPARDSVRRDLGWADNEFIVLHAGNMGAKQGLDNVVEAGRRATDTRCRFVLMGNGNQRRSLEEQAEGVTGVSIIDPVPDERFLPTLRAADALLVNERETLSDMAVPSKLTSYFAAGRPVVGAVNPQGITAEEIRSSGAGVIFPAGNPEALLRGVEDLAQDGDRRRHLAQAGPDYRERILGESAAVDAFEDLFTSLMTKIAVKVK